MASTLVDADPGVGGPRPREPWWARALRGLGWLLITAGVVVLLFIVYLLWWTDRETAQAQDDFVRDWTTEYLVEDDGGAVDVRDVADIPVEADPLPEPDDPAGSDDAGDPGGIEVPTDVGDAYALLWFERDGQFVVTDGITAAVEGVTLDHLARGPGHYPETPAPGRAGNVAFAGHRTTYGRPFHDLDLLQPGDEVHVVDRAGRHWVYDFLELEVVAPGDVWVVGDQARPGTSHLLTLTTCNPKYSAATRLVAFAELRGTADGDGDAGGSSDAAGSSDATAAPDTTTRATAGAAPVAAAGPPGAIPAAVPGRAG